MLWTKALFSENLFDYLPTAQMFPSHSKSTSTYLWVEKCTFFHCVPHLHIFTVLILKIPLSPCASFSELMWDFLP